MKFLKFSKKKIIILIIFLFIIILIIFSRSGKNSEEYTTQTIARGRLLQTVSETGTVKSVSEIDLNFNRSAGIDKILVKVGEKVVKDQALAELDLNTLRSKYNEAQAALDIARTNLAKLISGATREEINVSQTNVDQARATYEAALQELEKTIQVNQESVSQAEKGLNDLLLNDVDNITVYEQAVAVAKTSLDNTKKTYQNLIDNYKSSALNMINDKLSVANTALDNINTVITDEDADDLLSMKKPQYLSQTKAYYAEAKDGIATAEFDYESAKTSEDKDDIIKALDSSLLALNSTFKALNNCYTSLENSLTSTAFTQAELDAFKATISAQQTLLSTAIINTESAKQYLNDSVVNYDTYTTNAEENFIKAQVSLDDAVLAAENNVTSKKLISDQQIISAQSKVSASKEALRVAEAQLSVLMAPANFYDVTLYQAQVRQAEALLSSASSSIAESIIRAPIDGTITKVNYEIGEQNSLSVPVISMLGDNNFEIEVDISEADIAKIKIDNGAEITLDAYGDDVKFEGRVSFVEPAETIIQDVIYYKVDVVFDTKEMDVKSGMTANVIITTADKNNTLLAPSRAIVEKNGDGKFIRKLVDGELVEEKIEIGLRGDGGIVEAISGVSEGDVVVTYIKKNK